jgi:hypothetical protein
MEIRFADHNPPHFHVVLNDGREVSVEMRSSRRIFGWVKRSEIAAALAWAMENRDLLEEKWKECNP